MSFALRTLTHPLAPVAWWALNTPEVTSKIAEAFGLEAQGRRLQLEEEVDTSNDYYMYFVIGGFAAALLIPIVAWLLVGMTYKKAVTDQRPPFPAQVPPELSLAGKDFKYPICAFKDDCTYCMHGWCLETVRAADTYQAVQAAPYWNVMIAFLLTWFAAQAISFGMQMAMRSLVSANMGRMQRMQGNQFGSLAWFVANFFLAWYMAGLRRNLRTKFGDTDAQKSYCKDMMLYWWCSCCVVIQEARQVDELEGVRVECCCKMVKTMPPQQPGSNVGGVVVVGQPVA